MESITMDVDCLLWRRESIATLPAWAAAARNHATVISRTAQIWFQSPAGQFPTRLHWGFHYATTKWSDLNLLVVTAFTCYTVCTGITLYACIYDISLYDVHMLSILSSTHALQYCIILYAKKLFQQSEGIIGAVFEHNMCNKWEWLKT